MPSPELTRLLNEQIGYEFSAHQQYIAVAAHYDGETLPQLAQFFYRQAVEERDHALMIVRYLLDSDAPVKIPGAREPRSEFEDIVSPIRLALAQEREVSEQINGLVAAARGENDFTTEQFLHWFVKEQVEEVATMSDLLRVVERLQNDVMEIENYIAREHGGGGRGDPTAPAVAGDG